MAVVFEKRLQQLQSVLMFLNHNEGLEKLKQKCIELAQQHVELESVDFQPSPLYNFVMDIDLGMLLEHNAILGNTTLQNLSESTSIFQEVIYEHCIANSLLPSDVTSTQITTQLKISNFPIGLDNLQINKVSELTQFLDHPGLLRLVGVCTGVSGLSKYTQSTKYICTHEDCEGHRGNKYIRTHVPGASEGQTIRSDFQCRFCGDILEEVKAARRLSDRVVAEIVPIRLLGDSQREVFDCGRLQAVAVFVRDDLVERVRLGMTYEVMGICRTDVCGEAINVALEANNMIELVKSPKSAISLLPKHILNAYNGTKVSPWRFPLYMAYRFAEQVMSRGAMIKLKLALLIGLTLDPQHHRLHILCVGAETSVMKALMTYSQQLSHRVFPASLATCSLSDVARKEGNTWLPYFIQAGSLSMSCGGVCPVGDLGGWHKQHRDILQSVLSSHKMFVDVPAKGQQGTGAMPQQEVTPLQCHVWGVYDPQGVTAKVKGQGGDKNADLLIPGAHTGGLTKTLLDAFSYIAFVDAGDPGVGEEVMMYSTVHTLVTQGGGGGEEEADVLQFEDVEQYLSMARGSQAEMSVEAESLMYNYYMSCRLARSSGLSGSDVPATALATLTSLAIGVAKLKLSPVVTEEDAVMAIWLYEETLTARFGLSVLNVTPRPHIPEPQIPQFLGKDLDLQMQQFGSQLSKFCSQVIQSRWLKIEE